MRTELIAELSAYAPADEREAAMRDRLLALIATDRDAFERTRQLGHVTASTWIVDPSRTRTLLTHHRKLGKWVQLGGHVDGEVDVRAAAMREAREESGLRSLRFVVATIYDVDVHAIPARGDEPAHEHFDVRFVLEGDPSERLIVSDESHDVAWHAVAALAALGADESLIRLARKTPPPKG